jgi:hypothetical protein
MYIISEVISALSSSHSLAVAGDFDLAAFIQEVISNMKAALNYVLQNWPAWLEELKKIIKP